MSPPAHLVSHAVATALAEDLGLAGDVTSDACIPADQESRAAIRARADGVICGVDLAREAFAQVDRSIDVSILVGDGGAAATGGAVLEITGSTRGILMAERVALNFLCHLSGVATATAAFVAAMGDAKAELVCTRKTTPGLRTFEKHAVACGGGKNHRFGLYDAVMIKDNHIAAVGDIGAAVARARRASGHLVKIEVEIDDIAQLEPAIDAGADVILLDNMSAEDLRAAVQIANGRVLLEASGGVKIDAVAGIAATGVDLISCGWITHSAPVLDLGLDFIAT